MLLCKNNAPFVFTVQPGKLTKSWNKLRSISLEEFYWLLRFSGCISQGKLSIEPHFPGHENKTGSIQSVLDVHNGNLFSEVNTNKMMSQWKWNALGAWMANSISSHLKIHLFSPRGLLNVQTCKKWIVLGCRYML